MGVLQYESYEKYCDDYEHVLYIFLYMYHTL